MRSTTTSTIDCIFDRAGLKARHRRDPPHGGRDRGCPVSAFADDDDLLGYSTCSNRHRATALVLLGLIFIFNSTLRCLGVAAFAAGAAGRIRQSALALRWINRALGGLFVHLGARIAMLHAR